METARVDESTKYDDEVPVVDSTSDGMRISADGRRQGGMANYRSDGLCTVIAVSRSRSFLSPSLFLSHFIGRCCLNLIELAK